MINFKSLLFLLEVIRWVLFNKLFVSFSMVFFALFVIKIKCILDKQSDIAVPKLSFLIKIQHTRYISSWLKFEDLRLYTWGNVGFIYISIISKKAQSFFFMVTNHHKPRIRSVCEYFWKSDRVYSVSDQNESLWTSPGCYYVNDVYQS